MQHHLDDQSAMQEALTADVLNATKNIGKQLATAYSQAVDALPHIDRDIRQVAVIGMGGSHLGAQIINSVFSDQLAVPLIIHNHYTPPRYINQHTLVIATSYSGNTEEVEEAIEQCRQAQATIVGISTGGKLESWCQEHGVPFFKINDADLNPGHVPRYGSALLLGAQLAVMVKANLLQLSTDQVEQALSALETHLPNWSLEIATDANLAKQLALQMYGASSILFTAEHLYGSMYIFKNQINESAKQFSSLFSYPELNHHLLEGFSHPEVLLSQATIIQATSTLYHPRVIARQSITKQILQDRGFTVIDMEAKGDSKLSEALYLLGLTSYTALYLAALNRVDPKPNPYVDELKDKLSHL